VLEHLCLAVEGYLGPARKAAGLPTAPKGGPDTKWQPSIGGQLLLTALRTPLKLPAPPALQPRNGPRPDVRNEFIRFHTDLSRLLESVVGLEWKKIEIPSPASRFLTMNIGDAFVILVKHAQKHLGQVEGIRSRPEFPAGTATPQP
jgi:hypothetical protein